MKILFTGGGTGGHFYPIIAVVQAINDIMETERLLGIELIYMSNNPYDDRVLFEHNLKYIEVPAGKLRRYFSVLNIVDMFTTFWGICAALMKLFVIYPDVVFGKGGYASFPALVAARILNIPVVIHESDSKPGRVNLWAGKFARKIAVSFPEAAAYFPKDKVAVTGLPMRKEVLIPIIKGSYEYLGLETDIPVIFIVGGSQGAQTINDIVVDILPQLVQKYQVIHQTGKNLFEETRGRAKLTLEGNPDARRYKAISYVNETTLRMIGGVVSLVISRAGSSMFEFAAWGAPSIIIPIPEEVSHDQRSNAFAYARSGAASVMEEKNLTASVLFAEIDRILLSDKLREGMKQAALNFSPKDAAEKIGRELIGIGLEHEQ